MNPIFESMFNSGSRSYAMVREDLEPLKTSEDASLLLLRKEKREEIQARVVLLSALERLVISRIFYERETAVRIAVDLGVSNRRVGQIMQNALQKLRKMLSKNQNAQ